MAKRSRALHTCYLQIVSPSEGWESKFHACQWELNKLPLKVSIYRKHRENMLYFWMFPGTMLLILFLALLICSECLVVEATVVNSKRHFLSASRRIRLCCCFRFCRSSVVLFVHCYTKSMLISPQHFSSEQTSPVMICRPEFPHQHSPFSQLYNSERLRNTGNCFSSVTIWQIKH